MLCEFNGNVRNISPYCSVRKMRTYRVKKNSQFPGPILSSSRNCRLGVICDELYIRSLAQSLAKVDPIGAHEHNVATRKA